MMDDWDSVSNEVPPDGATDTWDAVSAPQPQIGYPQQEQAHSTPSSNAPRHRTVLPDNLVITDTPDPTISPMPSFHESQTQQKDRATPLNQPDLELPTPPRRSRIPLPAPLSKRTMLFIGVALLLLVISSLGLFQAVSIRRANALATAMAAARATAATTTHATATTQAVATVTTAQQIYDQATSGTPAMNDPLSDNSNGWNVFSGGINSCEFTGGAYHLLSQSPSWVWCGWQSTFNLRNFALQGQMNIVQGNEGGMVIGTDAINNYATKKYKIYINSQGTYTFLQELDTGSDRGDHILRSGSSPAIKTGLNQANVITAIVNNSNFYFYVNHQFVTSDSLNDYTQSDVGFSVQADNQLTEAAFSNMKLWNF